MDSPSREGEKPRPQEPTVIQINPECLQSALKEFFDPLRTKDSRTDFFTVYRRESGEFDRDYVKKYDEDLNTSLIFAGLFSAVSSAFIIDVQSKLEPDPNDATAAYMQILIHSMNNSLFPDADPGATAWTGPPPEVVTTQSLLYASLATSLFAAFLAMFGKQWVNRYLRNRGGSAAEKSRDRQRKLDGFEKWHFRVVIESLPAMLQLALLLLGCALSRYLWATSHTVARVVIAFTLFGVASYVSFTIAATLYYNCPYQTPLSTFIRAAIRATIGYLTRSDAAFARPLRSVIASLPSTKNLGRSLKRFRSGIRSALESFRCVPAVAEEAEHIQIAVVVASPIRIFEDILIDWEVSKADARCISWMLDSTTDPDVILSTVRFIADTIWYPETTGALSPQVLADLFFDCLLDGQVIPGKEEHAILTGMALASVLSIQLCIKPESWELGDLRLRVDSRQLVDPQYLRPSSGPRLILTVTVLKFVAQAWYRYPSFHIPEDLPITHKLWLSRVILQTSWRWQIENPTGTIRLQLGDFFERVVADGNQTSVILKANSFLVIALHLGLQVDIRDLYVPNNSDALQAVLNCFHQRLQKSIQEGKVDPNKLYQCICASIYSDPFRVKVNMGLGISWVTEILNSRYNEDDRYRMVGPVVESLGKCLYSREDGYAPYDWILPLLGVLLLSEKLRGLNPEPHPGFIALSILSTTQLEADFIGTDFAETALVVPLLSSTLLPTHPLQSRKLALEAFCGLMPGWFSSQMENIMSKDLDKFLQAVGDPFQSTPDPPFLDWQSTTRHNHEPLNSMIILIEFASLDLWRNHLRRSNFISCEEVLSTEEKKRTLIDRMLFTAIDTWPELLCTPVKITTAIRRLEELQCSNTAEVVIMWAWTTGFINTMDHNGWKLVEDYTFRFYQTHGIGRLATLKWHIVNRTGEWHHLCVLERHYEDSLCRTGKIPFAPTPVSQDRTVLAISRVCQLRRLYHLFGHHPVTWREAVVTEGMVVVEEAVASEKVDEEIDASPGRLVTPVSFIDWACDYP